MKKILVIIALISCMLVGCNKATNSQNKVDNRVNNNIGQPVVEQKSVSASSIKIKDPNTATEEEMKAATKQIIEDIDKIKDAPENKELHNRIIENFPLYISDMDTFLKVLGYIEPYIYAGDKDAISSFIAGMYNYDGACAERYFDILYDGFIRQPQVMATQISKLSEKKINEVANYLGEGLYLSSYGSYSQEQFENDIKSITGSNEEKVCELIKESYLKVKESTEKGVL